MALRSVGVVKIYLNHAYLRNGSRLNRGTVHAHPMPIMAALILVVHTISNSTSYTEIFHLSEEIFSKFSEFSNKFVQKVCFALKN